MDILIQQGNCLSAKADALVLGLFEGERRLGSDTIARILKDGEARGRASELTLIHTFDTLSASRLLLLGLGKREKLTADVVRRAVAAAGRRLRAAGCRRIAFELLGDGDGGLDAEGSAAMIAEGSTLGLYRFARYQSAKENDPRRDVDALVIYADNGKARDAAARGARRGRILGEATNFARDLANEPANRLTPTDLAEQAQVMAKEHGLGRSCGNCPCSTSTKSRSRAT